MTLLEYLNISHQIIYSHITYSCLQGIEEKRDQQGQQVDRVQREDAEKLEQQVQSVVLDQQVQLAPPDLR